MQHSSDLIVSCNVISLTLSLRFNFSFQGKFQYSKEPKDIAKSVKASGRGLRVHFKVS